MVPMLLHTLYDATNATNRFLQSTDESLEAIGVMIGILGVVFMLVVQILVLVRFKKNTEKYCAMSLIPQTGEAADTVRS